MAEKLNNKIYKKGDSKESTEEEKEILAIETEYNLKIKEKQDQLDALLKEKNNDESLIGDVVEYKNEGIKKLDKSDVENDSGKNQEKEVTLKNENKKTNTVIDLKEEINKTFEQKNARQKENLITERLKAMGLKEDDFKNNKEWQSLSGGERLLVIEQLSQETLSHVKEIGEQRFQEKNKINFSWNPKKWQVFSVLNKIKNNILKAYWISKEEKQVIKEAGEGKIKPNNQLIKQITDRTADMHLNVLEKGGRAVIEFMKIDKSLPKEQQQLIEDFNESANKYARMSDSWRNEKAAKSKDGFFKKNYKQFNFARSEYENLRNSILKIKAENYEDSGLSRKVAQVKAMNETKDNDAQIAILQFVNSNPDAISELNKIKNESSYGRLLNNENIWRGIYIGTGITAKSISVSILGFLAAPLVAGAIGGTRARRKAGEKIDAAFSEGRTTETSKERRGASKKGLFDDKDANHNLFSRTLSGNNVSAKEVGAFIDADSQIQRLDNILQKIENSKNNSGLLLKDQLIARINYIEDKHEDGLINYGLKNPIGLNYELFKKLSFARVQLNSLEYIDNKQNNTLNERRETLLWAVMEDNKARFSKKEASFKNQEMLRGAILAGGFSVLGWYMREFMHGGSNATITNELHNSARYGAGHFVRNISGNETGVDTNNIKENIINTEKITKLSEHLKIEAVADNGQGAISTLRELQNNLKAEYGDNIDSAPSSVRHILNTDAQKLAQEYGMYKPGQDAESAFIKSGSSFKVDESGNVTYHEEGNPNDIVLEKGTEIKASNIYEGKMADNDHSDVHEISGDSNTIEQVEPTTGEQIQDGSNNLDTDQFKVSPSVDSVTREPIDQITDYTSASEIVESVNISEEVAKQISEIGKYNIEHLFPNDEKISFWFKVKTIDASALTNINVSEVNDVYKPLVSYMHKLHEITGLNPRYASIIDPTPENVTNYITRTLQKAQEMGKLDDLKL